MVGLLANTKRAHAEVPFPGLLLPVSPSLWRAPADLNLCRGPSNTSRQIWLGLLWGQCSFPLGLGTLQALRYKSDHLKGPGSVKGRGRAVTVSESLFSSSVSEEAENKTGPPGDSTSQTTVRTGVTGKSWGGSDLLRSAHTLKAEL